MLEAIEKRKIRFKLKNLFITKFIQLINNPQPAGDVCGRKMKEIMLRSKRDFFVYYFNNMMEVENEELYENNQYAQMRELVSLIQEYKSRMGLHAYSNRSIYNTMKKYYLNNWDILMWLSFEFEKGNIDFPITDKKISKINP